MEGRALLPPHMPREDRLFHPARQFKSQSCASFEVPAPNLQPLGRAGVGVTISEQRVARWDMHNAIRAHLCVGAARTQALEGMATERQGCLTSSVERITRAVRACPDATTRNEPTPARRRTTASCFPPAARRIGIITAFPNEPPRSRTVCVPW